MKFHSIDRIVLENGRILWLRKGEWIDADLKKWEMTEQGTFYKIDDI